VVGEVFQQQISLRDECLEPFQSSPRIRVRAPRKPAKGGVDIISNIADMESKRGRSGVKLPPKAVGLTADPSGPGVPSRMEKPHLALPKSAREPEHAMGFVGLHISDLFVTNPEFPKLKLLCLSDQKRDTGYGIWVPDICPVHLIFVVRRWMRPNQDVKFCENRADQSLEFFDFSAIVVQRPELLGMSP
jgi:hypothetical protein